MYLKEVKDYDKFSDEADIVVSDGQYELMCYCHPSDYYNIGVPIKEISAVFASNIMRVQNKAYSVLKLEDYYAYHLQGEIIDIDLPSILIGGLKIILDSPLPKDVILGDYVELDVDRLNCRFN